MVRPAGTWEERRKAHLKESAEYRGTPGWKLKWWRLQRELTQQAAAEVLCCSQPSLAEFEMNKRPPFGELLEQLERRTGVRWP